MSDQSKDNATPKRRITALSEILSDPQLNDEAKLLRAVAEGYEQIRKIEKEDALMGCEIDKGTIESVGDAFCAAPSTVQRIEKFQDGGAGPSAGPNLLRTNTKHAIYEEAEEEKGDTDGEGMFGTAKAPGWSLGVYFRSVGSTREKRVIAWTAWIVCFLSLLVALVFISTDFVESRNSVSKAVQYQEVGSLPLPDLQICNVDTSFPPFFNLPNKDYVGFPTTWIDTILYPGKEPRAVRYPDTHNKSLAPQVQVVALNQYGAECQGPDKADPLAFFFEMQNPPSCFYCIYIKRSPAIVIDASSGTLSHLTSKAGNSFAVRISRSRLLEKCRLSFAPPSTNEKRAFRTLIRRHGVELEKQGILDFGGMNVSDPSTENVLFPAYRARVQDFYVRDVMDMFCNVYLFSGFFFPATRGDIRYKFNRIGSADVGIWQRSGRGPYFPPNYAEWFQVLTMQSNRNNTIGGELTKYYVSRGDMMVVFTNASASGRLHQIASQNPGSLSEIALHQAVIKGKQIYSGHSMYTDLKMVDARGVDFVYMLVFGFSDFVTKIVSDQVTASSTAYLADVFGLISLFMDVSVYTAIVSPVLMRYRRRMIRAEVAEEAV